MMWSLVGLKLNIWKSKIMTSDPNISCQTEREKVETVTDFLYSVSKITVDGDCSHEIKRRLLLGKKAMTNLESIIKSRDITLLTKVKAMVSPVVVYACDNWAIEKAECWRVDTFKLWCWRKLLRVLWTARREITPVNPKGNKPWIFIGRTDTEAPILWPPDAKSQLIGKDPDAGKDWRQKKRETVDEMVRYDTIPDSIDMNSSKLQEIVKDREAWSVAVHQVAKSQTWLSDWATRTD